MRKKKIIYVNFSQYDNTGRILDYLIENFEVVVQFSFDHLRLKNGRKTNYLRIYKNKRLVEVKKFSKLRTTGFLLFPSLPLVALLMFYQTIFSIWKLKRKYGTFDYYFTVNAFSAWIGLLVKKFSLVNKTIFWVWDYFPIEYPDWRLKFARWIYWQFDKPCMLWSDTIAFTNERLLRMRMKSGHLPKNYKHLIVPLGTKIFPIKFTKKKKGVIGFLGMLKEHQGLDLWLDNLDYILSHLPDISIEIIGSGPTENFYRNKAKKYPNRVKFYGFIEDQDKIQKIIKKWSIGLATYYPIKSNESYWGDPSKIKTYLGVALPVITTNVSYFSNRVKKSHAGIVINYNKKSLVEAISTIRKHQIFFSKSAYNLAKKFDYRKIYGDFFE